MDLGACLVTVADATCVCVVILWCAAMPRSIWSVLVIIECGLFWCVRRAIRWPDHSLFPAPTANSENSIWIGQEKSLCRQQGHGNYGASDCSVAGVKPGLGTSTMEACPQLIQSCARGKAHLRTPVGASKGAVARCRHDTQCRSRLQSRWLRRGLSPPNRTKAPLSAESSGLARQ